MERETNEDLVKELVVDMGVVAAVVMEVMEAESEELQPLLSKLRIRYA